MADLWKPRRVLSDVGPPSMARRRPDIGPTAEYLPSGPTSVRYRPDGGYLPSHLDIRRRADVGPTSVRHRPDGGYLPSCLNIRRRPDTGTGKLGNDRTALQPGYVSAINGERSARLEILLILHHHTALLSTSKVIYAWSKGLETRLMHGVGVAILLACRTCLSRET